MNVPIDQRPPVPDHPAPPLDDFDKQATADSVSPQDRMTIMQCCPLQVPPEPVRFRLRDDPYQVLPFGR